MHLHPTAALFMSFALAAAAHADCARFYDSLDSAATVATNNGSISGAVSFSPAVNGNGAALGADGHITYAARSFRPAAGTLAMWFRRAATAPGTGIAQIGTVGQASSIGLFYTSSGDLAFEIRSATNQIAQIFTHSLPTGVWTHVAAAWQESAGQTEMWLFVDGAYVGYAALAGAVNHSVTTLQVGLTSYHGHGGGMVDELRWFDWAISDSEAYADMVYSSNRYRLAATGKPVSTGPVQLIDDCLYVNGARFLARGVGYSPTPIGPHGYSSFTDNAILARDVPLLQAMNANTIRTWSQPPNTQLLDAMYYNGGAPVYTIIGFWVAVSGVDYADPAVIASYENQFRSLVAQFKDHPGVLAWGIGNEVNLSNNGARLAAWYRLANRLAQVAYETEGARYHPTIVVNGALGGLGNVDNNSDDLAMNYVDVWGQNTYFGWDAHCLFDYYRRISAKPLLFTEYGIDAWDNRNSAEYPLTQAAWNVRQYRQIRANALGATVMAWSDEWWKADGPWTHDFGGYATGAHPDDYSNEEWWGLCAVAANPGGPDFMLPRQAYYSLGQEFAYTPGDFNRDNDVDLRDLAAFQTCVGSVAAGACGSAFDLVVNDRVDSADFAPVLGYLNGPDATPACAD